jgi:hypothetical protein
MKTIITFLMLCSLAFAQGLGGKAGLGGRGGFGGGAVAGGITFTTNKCGHDQSGAASSTNTLLLSCSTNTTVGDIIVVVMEMGAQAGTSSCADNLSNSWSATGVSNLSGNNTLYCYSTTTTGGAETVTVTTTNTAAPVMFSLEMSAPGIAFDAAGTAALNTSSTTWTQPAVTTTMANDVVISWGGNNSTNLTYTAGAGYTIPTGTCAANSSGVCGQASGGNQSGFVEYQIVTTATSYTPTATLNTAAIGASQTIAFKP